ncbi:MAG: GAF domain-containing protein [Rhodobacteraceae bacterium]|nr:GAF domain-containing protein [Paracoccaceae bacterium]
MTADPMTAFAGALAAATAPADAFAALDVLVQAVLPVKLVSVTTVEKGGALARRSYSNMPGPYPVSGTKDVEPNRWTEAVIDRGETFVANTLADIATVFPDHELIGSLGLGSVVNMPVVLGGALMATLNLLDVADYFTPARLALIRDRLTLPTLAAQLAYDRLAARG